MKHPIYWILGMLVLVSCKKNEDPKTIPNTVPTPATVKNKTAREKDNINHLFVANGGSVLYMKNGERRSQARFDTDGDFVTELVKVATKDGSYKDFDTYLIENKDTLNFFEDFGRITSDWRILKGHPINSSLQVVSYTGPDAKNSQDVETVPATSLVIFRPESKLIKDENSKEAEDYYTAMDDWNYYAAELNHYFKKLHVSTVYAKKRYLTFEIEDKKTITIDTQNKLNNYAAQCVLYKKGTTPIIVYFLAEDNNADELKNYLK